MKVSAVAFVRRSFRSTSERSSFVLGDSFAEEQRVQVLIRAHQSYSAIAGVDSVSVVMILRGQISKSVQPLN